MVHPQGIAAFPVRVLITPRPIEQRITKIIRQPRPTTTPTPATPNMPPVIPPNPQTEDEGEDKPATIPPTQAPLDLELPLKAHTSKSRRLSRPHLMAEVFDSDDKVSQHSNPLSHSHHTRAALSNAEIRITAFELLVLVISLLILSLLLIWLALVILEFSIHVVSRRSRKLKFKSNDDRIDVDTYNRDEKDDPFRGRTFERRGTEWAEHVAAKVKERYGKLGVGGSMMMIRGRKASLWGGENAGLRVADEEGRIGSLSLGGIGGREENRENGVGKGENIEMARTTSVSGWGKKELDRFSFDENENRNEARRRSHV